MYSQNVAKKITRIGPDNALYPLLPNYLAMKESPDTPRTALQITTDRLQATGMKWPEINDTLLQTYLNFLKRNHFLPITKKRRKEAPV